jgi:hypothetical protein
LQGTQLGLQVSEHWEAGGRRKKSLGYFTAAHSHSRKIHRHLRGSPTNN